MTSGDEVTVATAQPVIGVSGKKWAKHMDRQHPLGKLFVWDTPWYRYIAANGVSRDPRGQRRP